jgi:hypothetical protein
MGTVVHVVERSSSNSDDGGSHIKGDSSGISDDEEESPSIAKPPPGIIVLDDGSGVLVSLVAPPHMLDNPRVPVRVGMTVECIVVHQVAPRQQEGEKGEEEQLIIDQLYWITDVHAEVLRWAEIQHHRGVAVATAESGGGPDLVGVSADRHEDTMTPDESHGQNRTTSDLNDGCCYYDGGGATSAHQPRAESKGAPYRSGGAGLGYPLYQVTPEDVFDIIQSEADPPEEEQDNNNTLLRKRKWEKGASSSKKPWPPPLGPPVGYSVTELSKLLGIHISQLTPMIESLQLSARIYQDEKGQYLPL